MFIGDTNGNREMESISLKEKANKLWIDEARNFPSEHWDYKRSAEEENKQLIGRKRVVLSEYLLLSFIDGNLKRRS